MEANKQTTELKDKIINNIKEYNPSATSLRYIFKQIRKETGLYISRRSKKLPEYFTPPETYMLMKSARELSDKHSLLIQILIQTGLRISELRNLDMRDIKDNRIMVRAGKGNKDRYVPIGSNLTEIISLYCKPRTRGNIFVKSNEKPLTIRRLQQMVNEASKKAGLGKCHPHKLRHTYACILINKGFRLEDLQLFMGHSSRVTTEIYAKLTFTQEQKDKYLQLFP